MMAMDYENRSGMGGMKLPNPLTWPFLNEPIWRWFVFLLAISFLLRAWRGVLNEMK